MRRTLLGAALCAAFAALHNPASAAPPGPPLTFADLERMERESVDASLAWLARRQKDDGSWSSSAKPGHPLEMLYQSDAAKESDVMTTACALLAFIGDSNSPWGGRYQEVVARAHAWIVSRLDAQGCLLTQEPGGGGVSLTEKEKWQRRGIIARLNQIWGTLALVETVSASTRSDGMIPVNDAEKAKRRKLVEPTALKALAFIGLDASEKLDDRFVFGDERNVTMDEIALLASLRHIAGRTIMTYDRDFFENLIKRLGKIKSSRTEQAWPYRYTEEGEYWFRGSIATPQAMIAHVYLHLGPALTHLSECAPVLLAHPPEWNPYYTIDRPTVHPDMATSTPPVSMPAHLRQVAASWHDDIANEASWFWQAMAFRSLGGEEWNRWRASIVPVLYEHQRRGGAEAGSWEPAGPHALVFGREVSTAWLALVMQSKCQLQMSRTNFTKIKKDPRVAAREENIGEREPVRVTCTVCGIDTMSDTMFSKGRGSFVYYFCSAECEMKFDMDSEAYTSKGVEEKEPAEGEGSEGSHK